MEVSLEFSFLPFFVRPLGEASTVESCVRVKVNLRTVRVIPQVPREIQRSVFVMPGLR